MSKDKTQEIRKAKESAHLQMAFFDTIHAIPVHWDQLTANASTYLSKGYLRAIEETMQKEMSFRYILFYKEGKAVAAGAFQMITVDSGALDIKQDQKRKILMGKVLDQIKINCLINGTLFASGEHGFYYSSELEHDEAFDALAQGIKRLCALEQAREKVDVMMIKEYFPENSSHSMQLKTHKYRDFKMEPNMVLTIKNEWKSKEDYLASMTSKYRNKAKSNLKKSASLIVKDLSAEEIAMHLEELKDLFNAVHSKAKQKLGSLDVAAFIALKRNLGDKFILRAYFLDEKMVGFGSIFFNKEALDSNYVGLNYEFNKTYGVYQRILYDLVELAIGRRVKKLHFGRTASEMKSNLGAKGVHMDCYVRTRNSVSNKLIKPLVNSIGTPDFVERNPFKE